jgi:hypothetical protein
MFIVVATQPHPAVLFMAASSRHYWADGWTEFDGFRKRVLAMRSAKTIATWAAVACSMIAFSWVGLALLGF